ncbi:MAG: hypothetical protein ABW019_13950 [Chitinophagaceae bacterium]
MKTILYLLILLLPASLVCAQVKDPFPYRFSSSIYERIKTDSASWRGGVTASDLSFIGLYRQALQEWDKPRAGVRYLSAGDSIAFVTTYRPVDARAFILERAKENRVLIFNEAHYNPRHRVFVTSLLADLKKLGYTCLAAETFANNPDFAENSVCPTLNTGYYAMEPQFGNLIREANRLQLRLYPYEHRTGGNGRLREIEQAKNLAALLSSNPDLRLIVYCGFSHIFEDSVAGWEKAMAGRLKELTGIDPYTIDQLVWSERSADSLNNPYYRMVQAKNYAILADKQNIAFRKRPDGQQVDALLYSPPTTYIHNRPGWIFENGQRPFLISKDSVTVSYPFLAKVYFSESDISNLVVPADMIEIGNEQELAVTAVAVYPDRGFIIELTDTTGKTQLIRPADPGKAK